MSVRLSTTPARDCRTVHLLDGRSIVVDAWGRTDISNDVRNTFVDFSWRRSDIAWHASAVETLLSMLSTHSVTYVANCVHFTRRFVEELRARDLERPELDVEQLSIWPGALPISGWPFFRASLARWVERGRPGAAEEVARFLEQPEQFEEDGNGAYFALVANDPERGALTEQELRSIRDGLNAAFERGELSLSEWTLVWFLCGFRRSRPWLPIEAGHLFRTKPAGVRWRSTGVASMA